MRTYVVKEKDIKREWYLVNAENKILGRLATEIARILRGKHKPYFTPYLDTGDFVVVINAEKVVLTGKKFNNKIYYKHSGYPGGLKAISAKELLRKKPEEIIKRAIKGMLPKNSLGRKMFKKLKVYRGPEHPHKAQQPKEFNI
jgi:large subunit ribosomal protein L13